MEQHYQQQIISGLEQVGQPSVENKTLERQVDQPQIHKDQLSISPYQNWEGDDLDQIQQIKENLIRKNLTKMRRLLSSGKLRNIHFLDAKKEDDIEYLALNEIIGRKYHGLSYMDDIKDELKEKVETQVAYWFHWDQKSHEQKLALIEMQYEKNEKALQKFLVSKQARDFLECYQTIQSESKAWEVIEIEQRLRYGKYRRPRNLNEIKPKNNWFGKQNHATLDPQEIYHTIQKAPVKTLKKESL